MTPANVAPVVSAPMIHGMGAPSDHDALSLTSLMYECAGILPGLHAADALMGRSAFTEKCDDLVYAQRHLARSMEALRTLRNNLDLAAIASSQRQAQFASKALTDFPSDTCERTSQVCAIIRAAIVLIQSKEADAINPEVFEAVELLRVAIKHADLLCGDGLDLSMRPNNATAHGAPK